MLFFSLKFRKYANEKDKTYRENIKTRSCGYLSHHQTVVSAAQRLGCVDIMIHPKTKYNTMPQFNGFSYFKSQIEQNDDISTIGKKTPL